MKVRVLKKKTRRLIRSVADTNPASRRMMYRYKARAKTVTGPNFVQIEGKSYSVIRSRIAPDERRIGIYVRGGCDLGAMLGVPRLLRDSVSGTLALRRDSIEISGSRSDIMLQTLNGFTPAVKESMDEVSRRLGLNDAYFTPRLFEPTFTIPRDGIAPFEKSVIVLSIGPEVTRTVYRHREHGFLVDPGGFWLSNSIDSALANPESISWFAKTFETMGRLSVEGFRSNFRRLIAEVTARTNGHVLVFNLLTPDPLERTHNLGLSKEPDTARRIDFAIALAELSHELGFDVVDVDRILKLEGVEGQVDFAHFMADNYEPISREVYRVLKERELV